MSVSNDTTNYKLAKENQEIFSNTIQSCMNNDLNKLKTLLNEFLSTNPTYTAEDFFTGFKSEGKTLLHIASSSGHFEIYEYILKYCKSSIKEIINRSDEKGFTPLIYAVIGESTEIITSLIKLGANVNHQNHDGASAMHFAAGDGNVMRMQLLYDSGALLDQRSKTSGTPMHWAAGKARAEAIKFLIDKNIADLNALNQDGIPAVLMAAVAASDLGVMYLVQAHADISTIVTGG